MENQDKFQQLYELWKQYYKLTVYKQEHFMKPLFHCWLGAYFTSKTKFIFSGQFKTFRVHPFLIDESGSGKSEAMKTTNFLLLKLGLKSKYLSNSNDSALAGNVFRDNKGVAKSHYGLLADYDALFWDEGSLLIKPLRFSETTQEIIQMTTDDPGRITKAMASGCLEYETRTTICAGSYVEGNIERTVLQKGMFQRMWVIFNETPLENKMDYIKHKASIIKTQYNDRKELMLAIKTNIESIVIPQTVEININDYNTICHTLHDYLMKRLRFAHFKDRKEKVFHTFLTRNDLILYTASHKALIEGKNIVELSDLQYGMTCYIEHLGFVMKLLMYGEKIDKSTYEKRKEKICSIIKNNPSKYAICSLRDLLISLPEEQWDLGKLSTYQLIKKLIDEKVILTRIEEDNKNLLVGINEQQLSNEQSQELLL